MYKELTPQEILLSGSTCYLGHQEFPYTPIAIQEGKLTVDECNKIRKQNLETNVLTSFWGFLGFGFASLENLNLNPNSSTYGQTINDPILIRITTLIEKDKEEFPFMRNNPSILILFE